MKSHFDELAKDLARGLSRREALGRFGIGIAAVASGMIFGRSLAYSSPLQQGCPSPEERRACEKAARQQGAACERSCASLRREERAACVAECRAQQAEAIDACNPCEVCTSPTICAFYVTGCNGNDACFCATNAEGTGNCVESAFCVDLAPCASSSDCPEGYVCTVRTCCGDEGVCSPICGTGNGTRNPSGKQGPTNSGR